MEENLPKYPPASARSFERAFGAALSRPTSRGLLSFQSNSVACARLARTRYFCFRWGSHGRLSLFKVFPAVLASGTCGQPDLKLVDETQEQVLNSKVLDHQFVSVSVGAKFTDVGCENCPFFNMDQDNDRVLDCTTPNFAGVISSMDPTGSWAARWQRISKFVPGCYALTITGMLPEEMAAICEYNNVRYVPRN